MNNNNNNPIWLHMLFIQYTKLFINLLFISIKSTLEQDSHFHIIIL